MTAGRPQCFWPKGEVMFCLKNACKYQYLFMLSLIFGGLFVSNLEAKGKPEGKGIKVDICHYQEDNGAFNVLNINENAVNSHLDHGDALAGDYRADLDGDGYIADLDLSLQCPENGFILAESSLGLDCNDSDIAVNPGAEEICGDGLDNNCNGEIDDAELCDVSSGSFLTSGNANSGESYDLPEACDDRNRGNWPDCGAVLKAPGDYVQLNYSPSAEALRSLEIFYSYYPGGTSGRYTADMVLQGSQDCQSFIDIGPVVRDRAAYGGGAATVSAGSPIDYKCYRLSIIRMLGVSELRVGEVDYFE